MASERSTVGDVTMEVFDAGDDAQPRFRYTVRVRVGESQDDHRGSTLEEALSSGALWAAGMLERHPPRA
jgi:hypothetical protein